ncbi:GTPase-associated system all-helical protein GASH [Pseudomonas protegens]|uniref:GTPase-associated system all-helical protein GASH n=1 Tax=Pseudomonas protegens TaxID=380021 RepID=UPI0022400989|nr:GTPase-associated system all-helical protein GASH [Pseudomonas protegens]QEN49736.1 hypothetical protein CLA18_25490 [Pseudomonas protegens]
MEQEFLLRFLEIGAIDLKGDDTKLEKLRSTAKDLSVTLRKSPSKTTSFTMVATDPNVAATDPTIEEAMLFLRKQWETVAYAFSARPVGILRAILLDAIVQAARSDDAIAVAFVNTARNALSHAETSDEAEIWRDAIGEIETKVDARAEIEWATPEMITVDPLQYTPPAPVSTGYEAPTVDQGALRENIFSAAGPWGTNNPNPYQSSQPQHWAPEFANKMSVAIAEVLNEMVEGLAPAPVDLSGPLSTLAKAVTAHVDKALSSFSGATAGLQRRTNLLWWKEALYSPSAHASYLDLPPFEASALMALDLHQQVPTYSPASVSAFLQEAIRCLPIEKEGGQYNGERDVASLVYDARTTAFMQPFRTLAAQYAPEPTGRGTLLSLIGHPRDSGAIEATTLRDLCGVDASSKMTPSEWGTYLFRELQSARAISGSPTKRVKKN